jgi:acyl-coenzyme A synthetase/AMP-(fatty) acid ligase
MSTSAPRRSPAAQSHRLIAHADAHAIVAYRRGDPVSASRFLRDVLRTAGALPERGHVLNFCADRYRFAVVLCAAIVRRQTTLLPPTTTPNVIRAMREFAPDAYYVSEDAGTTVDLPRFELPADDDRDADDFAVPAIAADQLIACVFTSGSTGEPQPHFKSWGGLVLDMRAEAKRLQIGAGHAILGTVPPQHMYGFESTILLPLLGGAALTSERLYYPADIDAAIERVPPARTLFTTPFHLRAWMESGEAARIETLVSATAPLSVGLARTAEERTGAALFEIYGCTEAGQIATRRPTRSAQWEAFDGVRLWNEGEQAMVSGGHVEQPTPLMDIIEVDADCRHFLLHGRIADVVNIAGKRNSIGYLDHQLTAIPGVVDGAFFLPDDVAPDGVTRLMAFVVAPALSVEEVIAALRDRIDPVFLPRPLVRVERLPRQLTGKLPREALRDLARKARGRSPEKP